MSQSEIKDTKGDAERYAAEIHRALETSNGDIPTAAELLGIEAKTLRGLIHKNDELKNRWANHHWKPTPPSEAVTIHRPALPVTPIELEEAEAIRKEDRLVEQGLKTIGLNEGEANMAVSLQQLHRRHFKSLIDLIGGGMAKQFLGILAQVEKIAEELDKKPEPARELMLREHHSKLLDLIPKYFDRANSAALTQAKVKALQSDGGKGKAGPGKPGFAPLIAVQGNVTIKDPG